MKILFIRHGQPDYRPVDQRGFIGLGRELAPLSPLGIRQAEQAALDPRLAGAQLILASPYTRALQTAAIVSRHTGLPLQVETDLHELIPDQTFQLKGMEENHNFHLDFIRCQGEYPPGETRKWETIAQAIERTQKVLDWYLNQGYQNIVVVAHGGVIRRYTGRMEIDYCQVSEVEYQAGFRCFGWVS